MNGKRVGIAHRQGKHLVRRKKPTKGKNSRSAVCLMICGGIVILFTIVRLFYPQTLEGWMREASELIGGNADFAEAFAAIGRAVGGEEPIGESLQDAYAAVFNPNGSDNESLPELKVSSAEGEDTTLLKEPEEQQREGGGSAVLTSSSVYTISSLPENASLEQIRFGFSYTNPVCGTLSSPFGWRDHPAEGGVRFHYGIDLAAEEGADIFAFADGEVTAVGESSTLGKYIILLHAGGYRTLYGHCSEILIRSGAVSMGDIIAKVGDTGTATGPHLHFEVQNGTVYFNPIYYVSIW